MNNTSDFYRNHDPNCINKYIEYIKINKIHKFIKNKHNISSSKNEKIQIDIKSAKELLNMSKENIIQLIIQLQNTIEQLKCEQCLTQICIDKINAKTLFIIKDTEKRKKQMIHEHNQCTKSDLMYIMECENTELQKKK